MPGKVKVAPLISKTRALSHITIVVTVALNNFVSIFWNSCMELSIESLLVSGHKDREKSCLHARSQQQGGWLQGVS